MEKYEPILGRVIQPDDNARRDAIHVAVAPAVAAEDLRAGTRVALDEDGQAYNPLNRHELVVGVVDPFLPRYGVRKGERFWLCLLPRTVTSLRHVWTHPAFDRTAAAPATAPVVASKPCENEEANP